MKRLRKVMSEDQSKLLVRVDVPDIKTQKCVVLSFKDTIWSAKQVVLDKLNQDLPYNSLNYGLYLLPSIPGKLGKYMEEGRALRDYVLHGHVPRLELRYKRRDYSIQVSLREKDIIKANSKANHRKFVYHVVQGSVKKVEKMLEIGIDPNFITEDGNTPLGVACGRNSNIQVIMPLLSNGAHIDFRGKDGLTALHRAALGGNSAAIKILLSYGASPNYRDIKGLTPLYHTTIMGDDTSCCESLLRYHADIGIRDHSGWTGLHQVSRHGHADHLDLLIRYKADIHAQNSAGNTPLHVAASHRQSKCALLLLKRGADKTKLNFSSQLPAQVAILCGHHSIATEINSFQPKEIELITTPPDYNPNARHFDPKLYADTTTSEVCPISPPAEVLVDTLTQEWTGKKVESCPEHISEDVWPKAGSSHSIPSMSSGIQLHEYRHNTTDTGSLSSLDRDSIHSTSTAGTPGQNTPQIYARKQPAFATQRERLYRAGPGKYVATENVEPKQSDDIPLRKGMEVEVVFIGKGGYWEGRAGGRQGWFPAKAIKDVEDGDSGVFVEPAGKSVAASGVSTAYTSSQHQSQPVPPAVQEGGTERWRMEEMDKEPPHMATQPPQAQASSSDQHLNPPSSERMMSNIKEVIVQRGTKGYGFAMRGVKATKSIKFHPTPQVPALQYVGNVEPGGSAEVAGLKVNDFLLEINGHNVTYSTHDDVVNIIRKAGSSLRIKIITPLSNRSTRTSIQLQKAVEVTESNSLSTNHRANSIPVPIKVDPPRQPQPLLELDEATERETVIDDSYPNVTRGQESPSLDRINQMGWDSSQDEEKIPTPTFFGKSEKLSYLNTITMHTMPSSKVEQSRTQLNAPQFSHPPQEENHNYDALESNKKAYREASKSKSSTIPYLPQKDFQKFSHLSESSESENESDFAQALKKGRQQLANSPYQQRYRSNTMPNKGQPSNQSLESQVERKIKDVQNKWNNGSSHSPSTAPKNFLEKTKVNNASKFSTQPLAAAIMRKIDSIQLESSDEFSSEEEQGTPQSKTSMQISTKVCEQPPPVQPKPHFRRMQTVDISDWRSNGKCTMSSSSKKQPTPTLQSSTTGIESSSKNGQDGHLMNWKSALRPVKTTESGRKHEESSSIECTRSDTSSQSPPIQQFSTKTTAINSATKVFNSKSKGERETCYDPAEKMFKSSPLHKSKVQRSFNENPMAQIGKLSVESEELPPPLPSVNNRMSSEFVSLPPPVSFVSVPGSSAGESSTDDFIPPPTQDELDDEGSVSSPPPLPDTSPPREPLDGSIIDNTKFPTTKEENTKRLPCYQDMTFPSPLPSPLHPSSFDADIETAMLLPPDEFMHPQGPPSFMEESEVGFQMPTTQKKVDTFSLSSEADLGRASKDFDEMIHQLQQLSVNLDTTSSQPKNEKQTRAAVSAASEMKGETDSGLLPSIDYVEVPSVATPIHPIERKYSEISARGIDSSQVYSSKEMEKWDVSDVCQWLVDIGLEEHCPQFQENEILGEHLVDLSKEELTELGMKKIGHKKTFLTKIKEFQPFT